MVTKQEMGQIMQILKTAYPRYYINSSKEDLINAINLWTEMFNDVSILELSIAVKSLITHLQYPPTISEIRKEIVKLSEKNKLETIDYWNEAYKMICNGSYMTEEEFNLHSDVCKRYFGSVNRLREKAQTENLNLEVEQSLFNKAVDTLKSRETQDKLLPENIKKQLYKLSKNMNAQKFLS